MARATQTKTKTTVTKRKIAIGGAAPKKKSAKEDYKHRTSPKAAVK